MSKGNRRDNPIAVVGMACRFPGASDYRQYWRNLADGVESITFLTDDELRARGIDDHLISHPDYVKAARVVDDMEGFDAELFGFTPREVEIRDPQSRLFLEASYAALEDGGYDLARYRGAVGVFGGMGVNGYWHQNVDRNDAVVDAIGRIAVEVSNAPDYLTTTVSHRLDLWGPSVDVQTACSTSLVALHLACQALRAGECDLALAGGVEVQVPYRTGYLWQPGSIDSRDGHCRAFDAGATGTIFGTGVGVVLLKRLAAARADGDHIHAVILGSAVNNDGAARPGFTAPGVAGQTRLIGAALAAAGVGPEHIGYVEAHGTGTAAGDPVELTALAKAFRAAGDRSRGRCPVGSVKSNIGHLGAASGAAGLIKACLALQHGQIPPSINFERPNPRIDLDDSPFVVNPSRLPWPRGETPRRAGVSAFGFGGTNAHVILQEPPLPEPSPPPTRRWLPLPVSARTPRALAAAASRLADHLTDRPPDGSTQDCATVARTLQTGRRQFPYRRVVTAGTRPEAAAAFAAAPRTVPEPARPRTVAYLFPGQGTQYPGMGRGLYQTEPVFRAAVDRCADLLTAPLRLDLRTLLFPDPERAEAAAGQLRETRFTQPALFTVAYALAEAFRSWGIHPDAMIGHSIGEWVAAHLAGVFSLPDALALVAKRGALMQAVPAGAMLAVQLPEPQLAELLDHDLEIAAVNAPDLSVVSGPVGRIEGLEQQLRQRGTPGTRLHTSHAFHSRSMEPVLAQFAEVVAAVPRAAPQIPFISNVSGTWILADQAVDPAYWARQLRAPVRFADGVRTLAQLTDCLLLELGPGDTLTGLARRTLDSAEVPAVSTLRAARRPADDGAVLAEALGQLWVAGVELDWDAYWGEDRPGRTPLPVYPFERRRYWLDPDEPPAAPSGARAARPGRRPRTLPVEESIYATCWQERSLPAAGPPELPPRWLLLSSGNPVLAALRDHLVAAGASVCMAVPGSGFRQVGEDSFTVRPDHPADLGRLLTAASGADGLPSRIVHGFTLADAEPDPVSPATVDRATDHGMFSLLHLAQEIAKQRGDRAVQMFAVSSNLQEVTGTEQLEPAKAMLLGPNLVIGRELPGVRCRSIDLALPSPLPPARLASQLFAELTAADQDAQPAQVAWRGRKRWVWGYEPVSLAEPAGIPAVLRERGVYLIVGGLGDLGLIVAKELARLVQARLVLIGRTPVPPRAQWAARLADPATPERLRSRLEKLREIEAAGGELLVRACDTTDEQQLATVVDEAVARFGAVHGAFHSAGVPGAGILALRSRAEAEQVLAPKVAGTLALHRVLRGRVDFLALFSSLTAVAGELGLVDYGSANNFQDAFARWAVAQGEPVYAIGWGLWRGQGLGAVTDVLPVIVRELRTGARSERAGHPLLDRQIHYHDSEDVVFATVLRPDSHWILTDHTIGDLPVVPGAAAVEMIRAAAAVAAGGPVELRDVIFRGPIAVPEPTELRVVLRPDRDEWEATVTATRVSAIHRPGTDHVKARARRGEHGPAPEHDLAAMVKRCDRTAALDHQSDGLVRRGDHWRNLRTVQIGDGEELVRVELDERFHTECTDYTLHPALLDDAVSSSFLRPAQATGRAYLPLSYGRIVVHAPLPPAFTAHIRRLDLGDTDEVAADIVLLDEYGRELVRVDRYAGRPADPDEVLADLAGAGDAAAPAGDQDDGTINEAIGLDVLRRILHHRPAPHLLVCPEGLDLALARLEQMTGDVLERGLAEAQLSTGPTGERRVGTAYAPPETELEELLVDLLRNTMGVQQIGIDDDFFELGGNSLVAVQLGFRLRELLEVEVPIASLLEQPTVRALAAALELLRAGRAAAVPGRQ